MQIEVIELIIQYCKIIRFCTLLRHYYILLITSNRQDLNSLKGLAAAYAVASLQPLRGQMLRNLSVAAKTKRRQYAVSLFLVRVTGRILLRNLPYSSLSLLASRLR